jgi:hypothetical protein
MLAYLINLGSKYPIISLSNYMFIPTIQINPTEILVKNYIVD